MSKEATARSAMKLALEALEVDPFEMVEDADGHMVFLTNQAITALREALAQERSSDEQPAQQEPFGYFQYDIRLDAWVQNRVNNKGVAFYTKEKK